MSRDTAGRHQPDAPETAIQPVRAQDGSQHQPERRSFQYVRAAEDTHHGRVRGADVAAQTSRGGGERAHHGQLERFAPGARERDSGLRRPDPAVREHIDPRLLAGVSRPRGALPDDTGRTYLAVPDEKYRRRDTDRPADPGGEPHQRDTDRLPAPHGDENGAERRGVDPSSRERAGDRADRLHALVDRPAFRDPSDGLAPDRYGNPLQREDGSWILRFSGRPAREQTRQGELKDCGVIAALGAVAAHRPADIAHRVAQRDDGSYRVRLNEARWTRDGAAPTGRMAEMDVTPELPVRDTSPRSPVFAKAEGGAAWSPVLEKAFAGMDQTWRPSRKADWADSWAAICEDDAANPLVKNPRTGPPPDGYARLNQGSTAWDRAEILTQLTGKESVVRTLPDKPADLARVLARQLQAGKPVLIGSRKESYRGEILPFNVRASHAYEVVAAGQDKITLRNPWNDTHPELMSPEEFVANMKPMYTTLK